MQKSEMEVNEGKIEKWKLCHNFFFLFKAEQERKEEGFDRP